MCPRTAHLPASFRFAVGTKWTFIICIRNRNIHIVLPSSCLIHNVVIKCSVQSVWAAHPASGMYITTDYLQVNFPYIRHSTPKGECVNIPIYYVTVLNTDWITLVLCLQESKTNITIMLVCKNIIQRQWAHNIMLLWLHACICRLYDVELMEHKDSREIWTAQATATSASTNHKLHHMPHCMYTKQRNIHISEITILKPNGKYIKIKYPLHTYRTYNRICKLNDLIKWTVNGVEQIHEHIRWLYICPYCGHNLVD